jgi:hypothetical protein
MMTLSFMTRSNLGRVVHDMMTLSIMAGSNLEEVVHSWKMLHRPKIVDAVSTNSTAVNFSFSLPFGPFAFTS